MRKLFSSFKSWFGFSNEEAVSRTTEEKVSTTVDNTAHAGGLVSPEGLRVAASVGGEKSERPNFFDNETIEFKEVSEFVLTFNECGHRGPREFKFDIWGNTHTYTLKPELIKQVDGAEATNGYCPRCFFEEMKKAAIRCCLCGHAILPGEGVALYHKNSKGVNKNVATYVGDSAIGCLLWNCCPSGGFFAGYWTFDGFKPVFGGETASGRALSSGEMIISDVENT